MRRTLLVLFGTLLLATAPASAQSLLDRAAEGASESRRALRVLRISGDAPAVDGRLDETVWQRAQVATGFVQRQPDPGAPASERTEARVLYGPDAIYIGLRMYDSSPDAIAASLGRRDASGIYSDWVYVMLDSYNDKRSAFIFAVNPRGVQKDVFVFDDGQEDVSWDAVWEVATSIDGEGWAPTTSSPSWTGRPRRSRRA